jgi:hopanoid biosynthesis associated RND transporter like protein HpnN
MHDKARHRFLGTWSRFVSHRPRLVLTISLLLALASVAVAVRDLEFKSNRNDLLSKRLDWNQRFIRWQDNFPGKADLIVVIDTFNRAGKADPAIARRARQLAEHLGTQLAELELVEQAVWGYDQSAVGPRALRLISMDFFKNELARIAETGPLLQSPDPSSFFGNIARSMAAPMGGNLDPQTTANLSAQIESLAARIDLFTLRLDTPADQPINFMARLNESDSAGGWRYLSTPNGRLLIIRLTPRPTPGGMTPYEQAITQVRQLLDATRQTYRDVDIGLTGIEVVESDESSAIIIDSTKSSIIAAVLIAVLLVVAFHSFKTPLMLMATLMIAVAWSFGFLTLTIGYLQVISIVFMVILLGLGVSFGIHLVSRFEMIRHNYPDTEAGFADALVDTFETTGPGVVTGAVTTAAAFCTTMLTDFLGVAEMGAIAAAGIIICLIAMVTVFPAMLRLVKVSHRTVRPMGDRYIHFFEERWVMPFVRHWRITLGATGLLTAVACIAVGQMRFDYNLLDLLPRDVPSVTWNQRIMTNGRQSIWFGVTIVDSMDQARQRAAEMRACATVESLGGVGLLIPQDEPQKLELLGALRENIGGHVQAVLLEQTNPPGQGETNLVAQLGAFRAMLGAALAGDMLKTVHPALQNIAAAIDRFLAAAANPALTTRQRDDRLASLGRDYRQWRLDTATQISAALDPQPLQLDDLPPAIMRPYMATIDGKLQLAMEVYPRFPSGRTDPLEPKFLGRFIGQIRTVDANITGVIVQIYESGTLIWTSYCKAGFYALIAVFILVWIDFRSARDATVTLIPVAVGFIITFGVMYCVDVTINPANIIVLPLMFGIGVDDGVHIIHRSRSDPVGRPLGLTKGTGKGISLTSYTTMIGFGALMLTRHRGIASLGFVLTVGIAMTMLSCWIIMPAWLEMRQQRGR